MAGQQKDLRQRKKTTTTNSNNKKKKNIAKEDDDKNKKKKSSDSNIAAAVEQQEEREETLSDVFWSHPLVRIAPFAVFPFLLYQIMYYVSLQHPEWVSMATFDLVQLRSSMALDDMRQVLIVGSEVAENRHIVSGLAEKSTKLQLEVTLEAVDASNYFCRDGTVSWFQIMRFLDEPIYDRAAQEVQRKEIQMQAWNELCINRTDSIVALFHPKFFGSTTKCSTNPLGWGDEKWSMCWARECLNLVSSMWGCAWKQKAIEEAEGGVVDDTTTSLPICSPPFSKVLHQVRHPLRTIERLNGTFCDTNQELAAPFIRLVSSWFPYERSINQEEGKVGEYQLRNWSSLSCLESMATYVIEFHETMTRAQDAELVHGSFQIEQTSPCELTSQAGFLNAFSSLYGPNTDHVSKQCLLDVENQDEARRKQRLSNSQSRDRFSQIKLSTEGKPSEPTSHLELDDFVGGKHGSQRNIDDTRLMEQLGDLIQRLGYSIDDTDDGNDKSHMKKESEFV